jgi:hypothetical protein
MSSESVCQDALSWVEDGSFHARLVARFMIFTMPARNNLVTPSYVKHHTKSSLFDQNFNVKSDSKHSGLVSVLTLSDPGIAGFTADTHHRILRCNFMFLFLLEKLNC